MKICVKYYGGEESVNVGVLDQDGDCTHAFTDTDSTDYYNGANEYVNSQDYTYCLYCGEDYYDKD